MAKLNITQALKIADVSKPTLYRHLNQGKISYETDEKGRKVIDTAELERVYGQLKSPETDDTVSRNGSIKRSETDDTIPILKQHIALLETQLQEGKQREERLHREKDRLLTLVEQQQTQLLTDETSRQHGFFGRLFGRKWCVTVVNALIIFFFALSPDVERVEGV